MCADRVHDLRYVRMRLNPQFQVLAFDQLDAKSQQQFEDLAKDPNFYGVLVPPNDACLPVKSLSRDAALLLLTLRTPTIAARLLTGVLGRPALVDLRRLIFDGIIEVEHDGVFQAGPDAIPHEAPAASGKDNAIARLSVRAIRYAAELTGLERHMLANRLYMFNRAPCTPSLLRQFAFSEDVINFLAKDPRVQRRLSARWKPQISDNAWMIWNAPGTSGELLYKLYISPTLDGLAAGFPSAVEALERAGCTRFKVGLTALGLLRPDKFVAYFPSLDTLRRAAELVTDGLAGVPSHGVPFTGAIDSAGTVSWGIDPPHVAGILTPQSWRQWIAERLATHILRAKAAEAADVIEFAIRGAELDGVRTDSWAPSLAIWQGLGQPIVGAEWGQI